MAIPGQGRIKRRLPAILATERGGYCASDRVRSDTGPTGDGLPDFKGIRWQ